MAQDVEMMSKWCGVIPN